MKTLTREDMQTLIRLMETGDLAKAPTPTLAALKARYDRIAEDATWLPDYAIMRRDALEKSRRIEDLLHARRHPIA